MSDRNITSTAFVDSSRTLDDTAYFQHTKTALKGVKEGTKLLSRIVCNGDSITFGAFSNGSTTGDYKTNSYPSRLAFYLKSAGYSAQSQSFIGGGNSTTQNVFNNDGRVVGTGSATTTGGPLTLGGNMPIVANSVGNIAFTPLIQVDTFNVWTVRSPGNGSATIDIDGINTTTINSTGTLLIVKTTITASLGFHTFNFTWLSGANSDVIAIESYNSASPTISVMNAGFPGGTTVQMAAATNNYDSANVVQNVFAQDLTIHSSGVNDWRTGSTVAGYLTNLTSVVTKELASGGDVFIVSPPPSNPGFLGAPSQAVQQTFVDAMAGLAVAKNCLFIDVFTLFGSSWATANSNGLMYDGLHPNQVGYDLIAKTVANRILY